MEGNKTRLTFRLGPTKNQGSQDSCISLRIPASILATVDASSEFWLEPLNDEQSTEASSGVLRSGDASKEENLVVRGEP